MIQLINIAFVQTGYLGPWLGSGVPISLEDRPSRQRCGCRQASLSGTDRTPFEKNNHNVPKTQLYDLSHNG